MPTTLDTWRTCRHRAAGEAESAVEVHGATHSPAAPLDEVAAMAHPPKQLQSAPHSKATRVVAHEVRAVEALLEGPQPPLPHHAAARMPAQSHVVEETIRKPPSSFSQCAEAAGSGQTPSSRLRRSDTHASRSDDSDGCQLRRSRPLLTRTRRSFTTPTSAPTGGLNSTPFAQDDYAKRLDHVSMAGPMSLMDG